MELFSHQMESSMESFVGTIEDCVSDSRNSFNVSECVRWTDKNGNLQEQVNWHRLVITGPRSQEFSGRLFKGTKARFFGRFLITNTEEASVPHQLNEFIVEKIEILDTGSADQFSAARTEFDPENLAAKQIEFSDKPDQNPAL